MVRGLTKKQEKFCHEYIKTGMATEAARNAGYSPKNSHVLGPRLLAVPKVADKIVALQNKLDQLAVASAQRRKERLSEMVEATLADYLEAGRDGVYVNFGPETQRKGAVKSITTRTDENGGVVTTIKMHDPVRAIAELNKMEGAYAPQKHEVTGKDGGPIKIDHREILWHKIQVIKEREQISGGDNCRIERTV